jgi:hypothetical protein
MLTYTDLTRAIRAAGEGGKPRPRIVSAEILFDEAGNILTYTVHAEPLHAKRGAPIATTLARLLSPVDNTSGQE